MKVTLCAIAVSAALLSGCAPVSKTSPVPQTEAQKLAMAREITAISIAPFVSGQLDGAYDFLPDENTDIEDFCEVFETDAEITRCKQHAPAVLAEFKTAKDQYVAAQKAMAPQIAEETSAMMAKLLSGEELAAMLDYYRSPAGKSAIVKRTRIQNGIQGLQDKHFAEAERAYRLKIDEASRRFEELVRPK